MQPEISLIVPLYNEEVVFGALVERLKRLMDDVPYALEAVLIDDGSRDNTAQLISMTALTDARFKGVLLSRNFGHQIAVTAGMSQVSGTKAVMVIDGDLQDPPELLTDFYKKIEEGYEVVYAIRQKRKENWLKKTAYWTFYRLLNFISTIDIPLDSGDFCMMSRRVCDIINDMPERSRFIRGMRTWVGFKQIGIPYERHARQGGEPKYNLRMLLGLAYDGIFNFSEVPLRLITKLGIGSMLLAVIYLIVTLYLRIAGKNIPEGFITVIFAISFFSGVQLVCLGVIGEYVSRIFLQVKERPLFLIKDVVSMKPKS